MIAFALAVATSFPAPPTQDREAYSGQFSKHANLKRLYRVLDDAQSDADEFIPRWLAKKTPRVRYVLVDREKPRDQHDWPGAFEGGMTFVQEDGGGVYTIKIVINSLIGDPDLGRAAFGRQFVLALCLVESMAEGFGSQRFANLGPENPVIRSMASFLGQGQAAEIDYLLCKHLDSEQELNGLLADIVEPTESAAGNWVFPDRSDDDLTFHMLVRLLTPKGKDKQLGALYAGIESGRPMEGALKKATRKKLKKLNPALHKSFRAYLDMRFPEPERAPYRKIASASEASQWEAALIAAEAFLSEYPSSMAAPNAKWLRARALVELDPSQAVQALTEVVALRSRTPYAWEAQLRLALLARERGDLPDAEHQLEKLRSEFGWIPGVLARSEEELKALGD